MDLSSLEPEIADSISRHASSANGSTQLQCCCGSPDCAFLLHGHVALEGLERDVQTAAKVGQALLVRHEAYVADAEQERRRLTGAVASLEQTNKDLESRNGQLARENETLHEQVNGLSSRVDDSDTHIKSLTATLNSTQHELQKLAHLASRAETLEAQLLQLESEQALLQATLIDTEEGKRAAVQRWHASQRKIIELEEQMDHIESEAREERERHAKVVEQMEKKRAFESELEASGGRLAGIAGPIGQGENKRSEVVSNFVKEILQDNANLQLTMVELQELLAHSNQELETLRQQTSGDPEFEEVDRKAIATSLGSELSAPQPNRQISQELHVHHHYHAAGQQARVKARPQMYHRPIARRPKPRPALLSSGRTTPSLSDPHEYRQASIDSIPELSPNVQQHRPRVRPNRWSTHSSQSRSSLGISSGPSSPQSTSYCPSTIFERTSLNDGEDMEYSRPTSPEIDLWSPNLQPVTLSKTEADESGVRPLSLPPPPPLLETMGSSTAAAAEAPPSPTPHGRQPSPSNRSTLHRTPSTTSLLSVSGMTLHSTSSARRLPRHGLSHTPSFATLTPSHAGPAAVLTAATASLHRTTGENRSVSSALRSHAQRASPVKASGYDPLSDTFGGFKKVGKVGGWFARKAFGSGKVVGEVVHEEQEETRTSVEGMFDEEALKECLDEDMGYAVTQQSA